MINALIFAVLVSGFQQIAPSAKDSGLKEGGWRGWLDCPGGEIPFELMLTRRGDEWSGWVANGGESNKIPRVAWDGTELVLDITHYDSSIRAKATPDGARLDGTWRKRSGADKWAELPFHATFGPQPRFPRPNQRGTDSMSAIHGRWEVRFASDEDTAIGVFEAHNEGVATGTFLTTTGDYRYLAGDFDGAILRLSTFDGAHAFLFIARLSDDGTLAGDFWSRDAHHDTWTAKKNPDVQLPDGFLLTKGVSDVDLAKVSFPDLEGKMRSLADPALGGKARVLEVFGTWCPNCHDASAYLSELHKRLRDRGLSVVGLAFELTGDLKRDTEQARTFAALHKVEYPILIAGVSAKEKAAAALPMLDKLRAYPTLIVLDGDGKVRAVYTGFSGPATGEAYRKFQTRFESVIEELLERP